MAKKIDIEVAGKYTGRDKIKSAASDVEGLSTSAAKAKTGFSSMATGIGVAAAGIGVAFGTAVVAAKKLWDEMERGAALNRSADQFDRLAVSINSTADSLLGKMKTATRGLISDAELMASGVDIMSLGLGKTEDQVVRLATVVGELGWDMGTVILTMANNSKMRLDALGLSVEDVDAKTQALVATGMSMDEAFDMAVIEAGEEKIKLLGSAADTTAGQMMALTTQVENARDAFSKAFAKELAEDLKLAGDNAQGLGDSMAYAADALGALVASPVGAVIRTFVVEGQKAQVKKLAEDFEALGGSMQKIQDANFSAMLSLYSAGGDVQEYIKLIQDLQAEILRLQDLQNHESPELKYMDLAPVRVAYEEVHNASKDAAAGNLDYGRSVAKAAAIGKDELSKLVGTFEEVETAVKDYSGAVGALGGIAKTNLEEHRAQVAAVEEAYRQAAQVMSSAFSAALEDGGMPDFSNSDAMKQSAFDMAEAFGLSVPVLADIGVQLGVIDSKTADAAGKAAIFAGAMQSLIGQLASGAIDPAQFTAGVDELIRRLNEDTVVEIQVDIKAKQSALDDIENMSWLPDAAKAALKKDVEFSPVDQALRDTMSMIDGIPDNDEKIITFTPEDKAVREVIDSLSLAIPAIPGTVTFVPKSDLVDNKIRELNRTTATVYVNYIPVVQQPGSSNPSVGAGTPQPPSPPRSNGRIGGGKSSGDMGEFYRQIRREGVDW